MFDQRSGQLFVSIRQTFAIWFIPLYKAPVKLTTVLNLEQHPASETLRFEIDRDQNVLVHGGAPFCAGRFCARTGGTALTGVNCWRVALPLARVWFYAFALAAPVDSPPLWD